MTLKQLVGRPKFKSVDFTIKSMVALITVSLIIGLLTIGFQSPVNWGGYHGRYVNNFIVHFFGWSGAVILCLFLISCFVVICLRDFINWIMRIKRKRDERKRIEAEKRELRLEREREIEEMRRFEEADAAKAGEVAAVQEEETDDDTHVVFEGEESGLYSSLPDFDEVENDSPAVYGVVRELKNMCLKRMNMRHIRLPLRLSWQMPRITSRISTIATKQMLLPVLLMQI